MLITRKIVRPAIMALALIAGTYSAVSFAHGIHNQADKQYVSTSTRTLSLSDLEAIVTKKGITPTEFKVEGLLLEVEGRNADGREVELTLDRRTGDIMHAEYDD